MKRARAKFPYTERAAEAEAARRAVHTTFRSVRRRTDPSDPATAAWHAAIADFNRSLAAVLPPDFCSNFERLRAGDPEPLEQAVEFLEADPWFHRSGYLKEDVIRMLKKFGPPAEYADRLRSVVLQVVESGDRREFRSYCRLACRIKSESMRAELYRLAKSPKEGIGRRARWMLDALERE